MLAKSVRKYIRVTDDFDYLRPGQEGRQGGRRGYSEAATATAAAATAAVAAGNHFRSQLATFCGHVERCASVCVCLCK